ncbi:MAG: LacI family DNA-binding transcriptional regulator [Spirochaetaceae bacterium]
MLTKIGGGSAINRITMKDIAKIAGTSLSTVSRSLNNHPSISEETRRRIQAIARSYDFEVNMSARSLATSRNSTIGLIYPESLDNEDNFSYAGMLLRNIREILEAAGLDLLISFTTHHATGESNIKRLIRQGKVDGMLLIQPFLDSVDFADLKESGVPYILLHFLPEGLPAGEVNYVYADHVYGGYIATRHLIGLGCGSILCITERERQFRERTEGFRAAHREAGLPVYEQLIHSDDASYEAGYRSIYRYKEELEGIDGIFVQSDIAALGAMEALNELDIHIPEDIPLVGYDDIRMASIIRPRLTTVHQPHREIVQRACTRLVEMLSGASPQPPLQETLPPRLVIRDSAPQGAFHKEQKNERE